MVMGLSVMCYLWPMFSPVAAAAPAPAKAEVSQNSESSGYVTVEAASAPAPGPAPAPAPEKINGAAKLFGAAVNGIEKDKNDNKREQRRKSGAPEDKPLPAEATAKLEAGGEQAGPQQPKRPSYRVLEDPDLEVAPPSRPGISSPRHRHETSLRRSFVKITKKQNKFIYGYTVSISGL